MNTFKPPPSFEEQTASSVKEAQFLGSLLDGASALVALKDLDHRFLFANRELESLYGVAHGELIGKTSALFLSGHHLAEIHAREDLIVKMAQPAYFIEHVTIEGREYILKTIRFHFRDDQGNIAGSGFVGMVTDRDATLSTEQRNTLRKAKIQTTTQIASPTSEMSSPLISTQLVWRASYECGNPTIDEQHRDLFHQCNQLLLAFTTPVPKVAIHSMLAALQAMLIQHFRDEESIMAQAGYPHVREHRATHEKMLDDIAQLLKQFDSGQLRLDDFIQMITDDIIYHHLTETDHDYFAFINPYFPIQP